MTFLTVKRAIQGYCNLKYAIGLYLINGGRNPYLQCSQVDARRDYELNQFYQKLELNFNKLDDTKSVESPINFDAIKSVKPLKFRYLDQKFFIRDTSLPNKVCGGNPISYSGYGIDNDPRSACYGTLRGCFGEYGVKLATSNEEGRLYDGFKTIMEAHWVNYQESAWKGLGSEDDSRLYQQIHVIK